MRKSNWMSSFLLIVLTTTVAALSMGAQHLLPSGNSVMKPDDAMRKKWRDNYNNAPKAPIIHSYSSSNFGATSYSLLSYLQYTPSERNQKSCGNCWVWGSTGVMEIALNVQKGVKDRLSIQWCNANCPDVTGDYACDGGDTFEFAKIYTKVGLCVPWSNTNAQWQDGDGSYHTKPSQITTTPNYAITSITAQTIQTYGLSQATAISNIKNVLDQNKAIAFSFYAPTEALGDTFDTFWSNDSESTLFSYDAWSGKTWSSGWGHEVLLVGYDESDSSNPYWVILNSWGSSTNRPNGLYRLKMNCDYSAYYVEGGAKSQLIFFETLDVAFSGSTTTYSISGTVSGSVASGVTMALSGGASKSTTTGTGGTYTFSGLSDGSYTVTPSYSGATFSPTSQSVTVSGANKTGVNFTSTGGSTSSITVTSPATGAEWDTGTTQAITWTYNNVSGNVVVSVLKGGTQVLSADAVSVTNGTMDWAISTSLEAGADYQVKITSQSDTSIYGISGYFSLVGSSGSYYATIGSAYTLSGVTFPKKPKVYVEYGGKLVTAKIISYATGGDSVTFVWTGKVPEGTYSLYSLCKGEDAVLWTDNFIITAPTLASYAEITPPTSSTYAMQLSGVTGSYKSGKPKVWWYSSSDGKKLNCTVYEIGYDEDTAAEYVCVKYSCKSFEKYDFDTIYIKNSLGENSYELVSEAVAVKEIRAAGFKKSSAGQIIRKR